MANHRSVLVTGANGYIGSAVCRAFVRAGWHVYGLVRRPEAAKSLTSIETIPIIGSLSDLSFLDRLYEHTPTLDVIATCIEPPDFIRYYDEVIPMLRSVSEASNGNGVRPLVLWTSGCKDYGTTAVDGAHGLAPHTEESPINPPPSLVPRATYSLKVFEHTDLFDAAVLRPTNVYGYSSSYYGVMFDYAATVVATGAKTLKLGTNPKSIMNALHVDDCADAYVALAEHPDRKAIGGQCFNISAPIYETTELVLNALAKEYDFPEGAEFVEPHEWKEASVSLMALCGFSQWVGSEKIGKLTGWTIRRMLFCENLHAYRLAWEASVSAGHEDIARVRARRAVWEKNYFGKGLQMAPKD